MDDLPKISSIIKTEAGVAVIFYYNHRAEIKPNLTNSWNLIYNYAKQNKQNLFFQNPKVKYGSLYWCTRSTEFL